MEEIGVYIHIPFCKKKCEYCDFTSFCNQDDYIEKYVESFKKEIISKKQIFENRTIKTIYVGGGTPSYIDANYIKQIFETINEVAKIDEKSEITIEVNPGTFSKEKFEVYKSVGINRVSIGLQSANDKLLKTIGRIHSYQEFLNTYKEARNYFNNINVDLMIGLPDQTLEDVTESLDKVINLNPEHISVYSLILEENTPMYYKEQTGNLNLPDEELERNMYWKVKNELEKNNYKHYEISNFAKPGFESKHNMDCWGQKEYIGFGLGASSYYNKQRFSNISNMKEYIENIEENNFDKNVIVEECQNLDDEEKEFMLLGLRKIDGVSISDFYNKFNEKMQEKFSKEIEKLEKEKLIEQNNNIKLTSKGIDLANIVWEEFI